MQVAGDPENPILPSQTVEIVLVAAKDGNPAMNLVALL
jgi:hypothetical protein